MKRLTVILASCVILAFVAAQLRAADVTENDLKQIGLAYHNYQDTNRKAPAKADDLAKYLDKDAKRLVELISNGDVVFVFDVGILDMKEGTSKTVLAYT